MIFENINFTTFFLLRDMMESLETSPPETNFMPTHYGYSPFS